MEPQKRHQACKTDWGNTYFCDVCLDIDNCPVDAKDMKRDIKGRTYADFAKVRANIEKMPNGDRKTKAIIACDVIAGLCFENNP